MFANIVVGTDGSETADEAVELAIALARESGATLHIVNAYRTTAGAGQLAIAGAPVPANTALGEVLGTEASQQLLDRVAARATGLEVRTHPVNESPPDAVIHVAEQVGADLIIVGNKGMERRVLGSVPNSIAHKSPCNLLIAKTT
ncbi:MAG: universal stress protein [Acidimicrobiales bacterium]